MAYDVAIIGAGMAGAGLAATLAPHVSVVILEAEDQPGYHATGRSAAFWSETYGGPHVQPLSSASGPFLRQPPSSFSEQGFLRDRGALTIGRRDDDNAISAFVSSFAGSDVDLSCIAAEDIGCRIPGIRPEWCRGVWEPSTADIEVGRLHAAYLRSARQHGADVLVRRRISKLSRAATGWEIEWAGGSVRAQYVVNAAGAWVDDIAKLAGVQPLGIQPYRRTIVQLEVDAEVPADLPLVVDINERFYFKREGRNRLWLSPHDEAPSEPCDAAPEEIDIATAIDRFECVVNWPVVRVERSWAGLRSFAPDRIPVFGPDPAEPSFFWCAGQGGFGIQTAPAISEILAAAMLSRPLGPGFDAIDADLYSPSRDALRTSSGLHNLS